MTHVLRHVLCAHFKHGSMSFLSHQRRYTPDEHAQCMRVATSIGLSTTTGHFRFREWAVFGVAARSMQASEPAREPPTADPQAFVPVCTGGCDPERRTLTACALAPCTSSPGSVASGG